MRYRHVCLEGFGYALPPCVVTSAQLERELAPVYERFNLHEGRLELMTGIKERRFWEVGTLPSDADTLAGARRPGTGAHQPRSDRVPAPHGRLARFSRTRHRLRRASQARPARRRHGLRYFQRLFGFHERHHRGREHDRAGADQARADRGGRVGGVNWWNRPSKSWSPV